MSALRPFVLGIVVWGVVANEVRADPISWQGWLAYIVNQTEGGSGNRLVSGRNGSGPIVYTPQPASPPVQVPVSAQPQPVIANAPVNGGLVASPITTGSVSTAPVAASPPATMGAAAAPTLTAAPYDAFINLGTGPYPAASSITAGNAQPWYNSSEVATLFGGQPTAAQQQSFDNTILQRVQQTFSQSGLSISVTDNPNAAALHTLSVVSNTTSSNLPSAIGMTQIGGNGFSFIDVSAKSAQSLDQLEWIVAHNISHELMLAFGVGENYDNSGQYIDSKVATWSMMVNPNATFSPAAAQAISQALAAQNADGTSSVLGAQLVGSPSAVPEPATLTIWVVAASAALVAHRARSRRRSAA